MTHVLEGHTRDVLCLDVQKEAAFSGKDGNDHNDDHDHDDAGSVLKSERRQFFRQKELWKIMMIFMIMMTVIVKALIISVMKICRCL